MLSLWTCALFWTLQVRRTAGSLNLSFWITRYAWATKCSKPCSCEFSKSWLFSPGDLVSITWNTCLNACTVLFFCFELDKPWTICVPRLYVVPKAVCWTVRLYDTYCDTRVSEADSKCWRCSGLETILPRYCIITVYKFIDLITAPDCIIPCTRLSAFWVWRLLCACFYDASAASK